MRGQSGEGGHRAWERGLTLHWLPLPRHRIHWSSLCSSPAHHILITVVTAPRLSFGLYRAVPGSIKLAASLSVAWRANVMTYDIWQRLSGGLNAWLSTKRPQEVPSNLRMSLDSHFQKLRWLRRHWSSPQPNHVTPGLDQCYADLRWGDEH